MHTNDKKHDIKAALNYTFVIILLIALGVSSYFWYENVKNAKTEIEQNRLPGTRVLGLIKANTTEYRLSEMEHVLSLKEEEMRYYENRQDSILHNLDIYKKEYEPLISSPDENTLYEKFKKNWNAYYTVSQRSISLSKKNLNREALNLLRKESHPLYKTMVNTLDELIALNVISAAKTADYSNNQSSKYKSAIFIILLLGGFALMIFLYDVYKKIW